MPYSLSVKWPGSAQYDVMCDSEASLEDLRMLHTDVQAQHAVTPLQHFKVHKQGDHWTYEFKGMDGREWHQDLLVESGAVTMTFDVTDHWKVPEFTLHRSIRDRISTLILNSGLTKVEVQF